MLKIVFLPFVEPQRDKCCICRQRMPLSHLAVIMEHKKALREIMLCQGCYIILYDLTEEMATDCDKEDMIEELAV